MDRADAGGLHFDMVLLDRDAPEVSVTHEGEWFQNVHQWLYILLELVWYYDIIAPVLIHVFFVPCGHFFSDFI